eukprot:1146440-Pelagomonas_calceolata.AAC.4
MEEQLAIAAAAPRRQRCALYYSIINPTLFNTKEEEKERLRGRGSSPFMKGDDHQSRIRSHTGSEEP